MSFETAEETAPLYRFPISLSVDDISLSTESSVSPNLATLIIERWAHPLLHSE